MGQLRSGVLSTFRLVWQAMGTLSLAADAAYLLTGVALFALGATPLSILLGILSYLAIMNTGYQFSKYIGSAGGYYTFVGKSLGGFMATFVAWNMLFYTLLGYSSFGFLGLASFITLINPSLSSNPVYWVLISIAAATISFLFTYFGIKISTDYQILGGLIEVGVLLAGSIALIIEAGSKNTLAVFTPKFVPGGFAQVMYSMIYSVVLFFGTVLSVTSLAEETKDPNVSIRKALLNTVIVAGITLIIVSYAFTVSWGPQNMSSFANSPDPGLILFGKVSIILFILLAAVTINSFMGYNVAVSNGTSRVFYAFARDGILFLPKKLSEVHPKYGSPHYSALFVYITSLALALIFGAIFGPFTGGLVMLYMNAYAAYLEHIVASIGLPFYAKKKGDFNIFSHLIIPIIAIAILIAVIVSTFYPSPPSYPYNIAAYVGVAWIGISALMAYIEKVLHPQVVANAGQYNILEKTKVN